MQENTPIEELGRSQFQKNDRREMFDFFHGTGSTTTPQGPFRQQHWAETTNEDDERTPQKNGRQILSLLVNVCCGPSALAHTNTHTHENSDINIFFFFFLVSCVSSVWHKYTSCTLISETQHVTGDKVVFHIPRGFLYAVAQLT